MKYIVIFVKGQTEEELYKNYILPGIKKRNPENRNKFTILNVRGIGGFKKDSIMKFKI